MFQLRYTNIINLTCRLNLPHQSGTSHISSPSLSTQCINIFVGPMDSLTHYHLLDAFLRYPCQQSFRYSQPSPFSGPSDRECSKCNDCCNGSTLGLLEERNGLLTNYNHNLFHPKTSRCRYSENRIASPTNLSRSPRLSSPTFCLKNQSHLPPLS